MGIKKVGEYDKNQNLIVEKPIFDLAPKSDKIFLSPRNTEKEIIRLQMTKFKL